MEELEKMEEVYHGFEQGPIRPPSEASSMLFRLTRNCSWNRCTFCSIYKGEKFQIRPVEDIIRDIDTVHHHVEQLMSADSSHGMQKRTASGTYQLAYAAASNWLASGCKSVFLQDGNSLIMKPAALTRVLWHIRRRFPMVERITSYARSDTLARISDENLAEMADAGLNRIHVGLETASDKILKMVKKGLSKETHIKAGVKVKQAGIELSEYVLTGIGGSEFSKEHATETADALNQINADFIRFRTLHIPDSLTLFESPENFRYQRATDLDIAGEIRLLISNLTGINSTVKSDHSLNLFQEVDGVLPRDRDQLVNVLQTFIDMEPEKQMFFQVGKRLGYFLYLQDMQDPDRLARVKATCRQQGLRPGNVDIKINEMIQQSMRTGINM
jgi:hypothetical protein